MIGFWTGASTMPISDTQRIILIAAAQHPQGIVCPPTRLPTGARQSVAKKVFEKPV